MTTFAGAVWAALRGKRSTALNDQTEEDNTMATQLFQPPYGSPAWLHAMIEKAKDGPIMRIVDMSPALAKAMLDDNPDNRSIRRTKLAQYSADMSAKKWTLIDEPVFDRTRSGVRG